MSRKMRLLLGGVVLVAIIAVAWMFVISPVRSNIASTDSAISEQQNKLSQAQTKLAAAQTTRAEGKKNQARLLELAKMVPAETQVPSLLVQIQDLADQSGIDFISVTPGEGTDSQGFNTIPLQLQFTGTYFDLSDFAYRVEQLVAGPGRLLAVKSLSFKMGTTDSSSSGSTSTKAGSSPALTGTMTLYAFSMAQPTTAGSATTASGSTTNTTSTASSTNKTTSN
jgi:type IV pilus assembly protein PilO